ncbi:alpha/beta hydrolase [Paraburkholderia azotifigens]|uniref:Alpha/beta hydrolase n=1 Tax=Paraburkholderia azotifigens TaxID=2057004 RepID=A0A5C6V3Z9_9BURK|nr:alpha/beta hydrolase [Paraburkholderia azotifigens]TXC80062.1 alpha/beta hydrolase [Paraburkholderia azotifigens]
MRISSTLTLVAAALAVSGSAFAATPDAPDVPTGAKNIVIVHGAFTDGSGWRAVHDILIHKGYNVRIVQPPMTTFEGDVAATSNAVIGQTGPVVLVGHGYGGAVITEAGARPKVKALVYVAAFEPDVGESVTQLAGSMPKLTDGVRMTIDGHYYFDPAKYGTDYAGDLVSNRTDFMAVSQVPATVATFASAPYSVAWHNKPTYGIVATDDRVINPDLQRWMYKRAGSKVTEVKASHAIEISQPEAVAKVIEEAALHAK